MWINDKKIDLNKIVEENGLIVKYETVQNMKGLGDSTIWRCTFENWKVFEIEFMPNECKIIKNMIVLN